MENKISSVFSKVVKAGKKRTYFFDVRNTKGNDYFLTITESRKRINGDGYEKNKIFLYKEDFNKFLEAMKETVDHVKTELLPDFDFDSFNRPPDDEHFSPRTDRENEAGETNFTPSRSQSSYDDDGGAEKLHREKPEEESPSNTSRLFQDDEAEKW